MCFVMLRAQKNNCWSCLKSSSDLLNSYSEITTVSLLHWYLKQCWQPCPSPTKRSDYPRFPPYAYTDFFPSKTILLPWLPRACLSVCSESVFCRHSAEGMPTSIGTDVENYVSGRITRYFSVHARNMRKCRCIAQMYVYIYIFFPFTQTQYIQHIKKQRHMLKKLGCSHSELSFTKLTLTCICLSKGQSTN